VIVEDFATIGGQTGVHQFVRIGEHAMVGGISRISRDVPPYVLVAGSPAKPFGLNTVGLQRADFTPQVMSELKECYNLIYRSGNNISQATEAIRAIVSNDKSRHLLAFLEAPSERGIVK
jgi:UDP-N-acetylglucosamine acyltransferase